MSVQPIVEVFLHSLEPHRLSDDCFVVGRLLLAHSLLEWPSILVVVEGFQDVVTLLLKALLLGALGSLVVLLGPAGLEESLDLVEVVPVESSVTRKVESWVDSLVDDLVDLVHDEVPLHLDRVRDVLVINAFVDLALHHR